MLPHASLSLLSALLFITFSACFYLPDSNPLLSFDSQAKEVHLYTENHRRGLYLQITTDGTVTGSDVQTPYSVLELKSVKTGHIVIRAKSSSLFLCMDSRGHLSGQRRFTEADCTFRELLLADGYTRFLSSHHGKPLSLAPKLLTDQHAVTFTRFLPLRNTLAEENVSEQPPSNPGHFNMDSGDLLGMGSNVMISPQFSVDK